MQSRLYDTQYTTNPTLNNSMVNSARETQGDKTKKPMTFRNVNKSTKINLN